MGAWLALAVGVLALVAVGWLFKVTKTPKQSRFVWKAQDVVRGDPEALRLFREHNDEVREWQKRNVVKIDFCAICGKLIEQGARTVGGGLVHEDCYLAKFAGPKETSNA